MSFVQDHGESAYHPCGTCRMGDDDGSVTDSQGVVRGVRGLRVVDASLMPEITNGNLNAVVLMMAEKISSNILQARPGRDHAV
jgi:choline dehydrogenase